MKLPSKALLVIILLCSCLISAHGAKLFRKQSGTVTLTGTTTTITILPVNLSKSFLVFSATSNSSSGGADNGNMMVGGFLASSTSITFIRDAATANATISWQVFEFVSGVTVQRGSTANVLTTDVAVSSVNLTTSFVIASGHNPTGDFGTNDTFTAELTTSTNLRLTAVATYAQAYWQVIQYDDAVVKKVTATMADPALTATSAITPAVTNLAKTMVVSTYRVSGTPSTNASVLPMTQLTNANTITYTRLVSHPFAVFTFATYVIEFTDNTTVARGLLNFASGATSQTAAITASMTSSAVFNGGNYERQGNTDVPNQNLGYAWYAYEITKVNNLTATRGIGASATGSAPYQIVTFENDVKTYYSLASGAWEANTSWSFSSDGSSGAIPVNEFPSRVDNVVIRTGHTITVNNVADNYYAGVKPDDLGQANIGSFGGSNLVMFYQTGNILINGTLNVSGVEIMVGGYTNIATGGTLTTSSNLVNTGFLEAQTGSTLGTLDDFILTGNSTTNIYTNSTSSDDLIIDHPDARLCGTGSTILQNGSGSIITYSNGATVGQVCTQYTITCTGSGCGGTFPTMGTGVVISGNTGPGGVGSNAGTSALKLWFRTDNGISLSGSSVASWSNSAGISGLDISDGTLRPTLVTGALNGFSEVSFDGTTRLRTGLNLTTSNFVTDKASTFTVTRADNTTQSSSIYLTDPFQGNRFSAHMPWSDIVYFDIGTCCGSDARIMIPSPGGLTNYSIWSYTAEATTGKTAYRNGTAQLSTASVSTFTSPSSYQFNLGGGTTAGTGGFEGDLTEIAIFNAKVNEAQRILIENYLAAKYNLTLGSNDIYTFDTSINYDYDVGGIGQASDGTYHRDARGTGIVRMWNPDNLGNSEFLIWGHNNATLNASTTAVGTAVDGTIIKERLTTIWTLSEAGDVGTVLISFDLSPFTGPYVGSNLRLLIDRDLDGFQDNDVTPITGSMAGNMITFSVNFNTGDRFTLGNTSSTQSLPIELAYFMAKANNNTVQLDWKTLTEVNNDFFEVERSANAEKWEVVAKIQGAGTSKEERLYHDVDNSPRTGQSYYRLKQTDYDGRVSYSKTVSVWMDGAFNVSVSPNPSSGIFSLHTGTGTMPQYIGIFDILGHAVPYSIATGNEFQLDISGQPAGIYILKVYDKNGSKTLRMVKE